MSEISETPQEQLSAGQPEALQAGPADPEVSDDVPQAPDGSVAEPTAAVADQPGESAIEAEEEVDANPIEPDLQVQQELAQQEISTQQVVEALLFASDAPLTLQRIVALIGVGSARDVREHIEALNKGYQKSGAAFRIEKIAGGYQLLTLPTFNTWLRRLNQSRQDSRFSPAALETLAVVAYKQPVVRAEIEAIRGVSAGEMLNRLRELGLIKIVGRAEDVGRPMLYGTTKKFLEIFGLAGLEDLPQVEQMQSPEP